MAEALHAAERSVAQEKLRSFVREMVAELVDDETRVRVTSEMRAQGLVLEVRVGSDADLGRVIGRGGATARALRLMVAAAAGKHRVRCELVLIDHCMERDALRAKNESGS